MPLELKEIHLERNGEKVRLFATPLPDDWIMAKWVAFIGPRKLSGGDFLKHIEWAETFPVSEAVLLTPFHSPLEKEVTRIVLNRGGRALVLPARTAWKSPPRELRKDFETGRVHFLAVPDWTNTRPTRDRCLERNDWIRRLEDPPDGG